ncbi:MAG: heavy metal translocating P-type ATPase, partial [Treponema sp.]|nr:heavy metal translocating P-type ATPase [Treponema sp.]
MELQFALKGLCCPICASKIEAGIQRIAGVQSAAVDFAAQRLTLETGSDYSVQDILDRTDSIVKEHEPDIVMERIDRAAGALSGEAPSREKTGPDRKKIAAYVRFGTGTALFIAAMAFDFSGLLEPGLFLASYLLVGGGVLLRALKNISRGQIFDENFLMSLATVGAFAIGEYPEGVAVMLFYRVGEAFQDHAVNRSRSSIAALMDIRPDYANLLREGVLVRVDPGEAQTGDIMVVKPGEKIPLDGVVLEGCSALDTSALSGESLPRDVEPGSEALSGSINKTGLLTLRVSKTFGESTVSKILNLVQNAGSRKTPAENFITKFARYYTPAVAALAVLLALIPPLLIPGAVFSDWINRALVFLVVSCPCALVISIPLSFFGGIGGASRQGILVKGSNYLDALNNVDTVVFDKTGTLTRGIFTVTRIAPAEGYAPEDLLYYAAYAENGSNHPIALSVQKAYGKPVEGRRIKDHEEIAGRGVRVVVDGKRVLAGNDRLLEEALIPFPSAETEHEKAGASIVRVAVENAYAGSLFINDEPKPDALRTIRGLKKRGVKNTVMLTGDSRTIGERIAGELEIDRVYAELLPHQKIEQLEALEREKKSAGKLVFVGDGINDAPALARSDIGIAMGGLGQDAAIEASDLVIMTDEPSKIIVAMDIARRTRGIANQNIVFALGVKGIVLLLGALGLASMWAA